MTTQSQTLHWVLVAYLAVYATAIAAGLMTTHNVALAAVHVALLTVGALTLRTILATLPGGRH